MEKPKKFGLLLYPGFEVLDVFGPLEALNVFSRKRKHFKHYQPGISLTIISSEKDKDIPLTAAYHNSPGGAPDAQRIIPQCTIYDAPKDLDFLLIPGGLGCSDVSQDVVDWVATTSTQVKYLMTVCTGADIAARAGVLNGLQATTNKSVWRDIRKNAYNLHTHWIADARWVKANDKIWTTAGVSAGMDGFIAWLKEVYGAGLAEETCQWMEYRPEEKDRPDYFSNGLKDIFPEEHKDNLNGLLPY